MKLGEERGGDGVPEPQLPLHVGRVARDESHRRAGVVVDVTSGLVRLRSLVNGRIWSAEVNSVRQVSAREELSIRLAAANARARERIQYAGVRPLDPKHPHDPRK